jgi:hypothetical protein
MDSGFHCMHQGPAAAAELALLIHNVAKALPLLLTPDAPPTAGELDAISRSMTVRHTLRRCRVCGV